MNASQQNGIKKIIEQHRLIPVVTFTQVADVKPVVEKLIAQKIYCIEVTLRTDCAIDCIQYIREEYGSGICLGVGSVVNKTQIDQIKIFSPDFLVSPGASFHLLEKLKVSGIAYLPGAVTPSEIILAMENDCYVLKFFPANMFGGLSALKTYAGLFPALSFCPTGGITKDNYQEYLSQPNVIAVGGSWLIQ